MSKPDPNSWAYDGGGQFTSLAPPRKIDWTDIALIGVLCMLVATTAICFVSLIIGLVLVITT